jgi:RimJ/RimL family protein N-acetyltransferase
MSVCFFLRAAGPVEPGAQSLPRGIAARWWTPRECARPPMAPRRGAVWLQDRLRLFADRRFAELGLWRGEELVHRLVVTPRWYRFPFMEAGDLQLGALWTSPSHRRQGLALAAISEAHRRFGGPGQRFWYVADGDNRGSIALARSAGYELVGTGKRSRPAGIRLLGRFTLDRIAEAPPGQPIPTGY